MPHQYLVGDYVTIAGATPSGYAGKVKVVTAADGVTFTYAVSAGLATPATGTITVLYTCDAQGGRRAYWQTVESVYADVVPIRAFERLQRAALQSAQLYRFRVRTRSDLDATMRVRWTPTWPVGAATKTLQINGVIEDTDRAYLLIEASEAA